MNTLKEKIEELITFNKNNENNGNFDKIINTINIEVNVNFYHDVVAFTTCNITHFSTKWIVNHMADIGRIVNWNVNHFRIDHHEHMITYTLMIPDDCEITIMNGEIHFS